MSSDRATVARELIRRRLCHDSLHSFALNIDIPTSPVGALMPDESLMGPAAQLMSKVHAAILGVCERTVKRPMGRALITSAPGTAKSTYVSNVTPPWALGRDPKSRIILASYASGLAHRQSRRARAIAAQPGYTSMWAERPEVIKDADAEWTMSNGSELLAAGLTAGITGNRANGGIIDDPVAGREEADSPAMRKKTLDAYQDDFLTRLLPNAWLIMIMTRWAEADLAGEILPLNYKGESGMIKCRDGLDWEVLNIPAKCEHADDPLGRAIGDYVWPEYYPKKHWLMFENGVGPTRQRTWSSLYQQRPAPQGNGTFTREAFKLYDALPVDVTMSPAFICTDAAVTSGKNDFTEHGVWVVDQHDNMYAIDWWFKQADPGEWVRAWLSMVVRHKIHVAFNEGGVIDKATRPLINVAMRDYNAEAQKKSGRSVFVDIRSLPSMEDKQAKLQSFQARCSMGKIFLPAHAIWTNRIIEQCLAIPAGRHDDAADVCGLAGRALDQWHPPMAARAERKEGLKPFTGAWLEYEEPKIPTIRYR